MGIPYDSGPYEIYNDICGALIQSQDFINSMCLRRFFDVDSEVYHASFCQTPADLGDGSWWVGFGASASTRSQRVSSRLVTGVGCTPNPALE